MAGMPISAAVLNRSSMRAAPSSMEYSVWTCRWTKESLPDEGEAGCADIVDDHKPRHRRPSACRCRVSPTRRRRYAGEPASRQTGTAQRRFPLRPLLAAPVRCPRRCARILTPSSQAVERQLEVLRVGAGKGDVLPRARVLEAEAHRMQPLPLQAEAGRELGV